MAHRKFTHAEYLSIEDPSIDVAERACYIRSIGGLRLRQYKDAVARLVDQPNGDESGVLIGNAIFCLLNYFRDVRYFDVADRLTRERKLQPEAIECYAMTTGDKVPETVSTLIAVMGADPDNTWKIARCYRMALRLLGDERPVPDELSLDDPSIDWAILSPYMPD